MCIRDRPNTWEKEMSMDITTVRRAITPSKAFGASIADCDIPQDPLPNWCHGAKMRKRRRIGAEGNIS